MTLFKITGMITGIALIGLSVAWSPDLESGAFMLFCGGVLIFLGTSKVGSMEDKT